MVRDMFDTYLDMCIAHFDMLWDAGYTFDAIYWPDDMGYKGTTFFSPRLYRELLQRCTRARFAGRTRRASTPTCIPAAM